MLHKKGLYGSPVMHSQGFDITITGKLKARRIYCEINSVIMLGGCEYAMEKKSQVKFPKKWGESVFYVLESPLNCYTVTLLGRDAVQTSRLCIWK